MDKSVQGIYLWSLIIFITVGLIGFGRKYTLFAQRNLREEYAGDKAYKISGMLLNSWKWNYKLKDDLTLNRKAAHKEIFYSIDHQ